MLFRNFPSTDIFLLMSLTCDDLHPNVFQVVLSIASSRAVSYILVLVSGRDMFSSYKTQIIRSTIGVLSSSL